MKTFFKMVEVVLGIAILAVCALYLTGAFDGKTVQDRKNKKIEAQLAETESAEDRIKLMSKSTDIELMRDIADEEADRMLKEGNFEAYEEQMHRATVMGNAFKDLYGKKGAP